MMFLYALAYRMTTVSVDLASQRYADIGIAVLSELESGIDVKLETAPICLGI